MQSQLVSLTASGFEDNLHDDADDIHKALKIHGEANACYQLRVHTWIDDYRWLANKVT